MSERQPVEKPDGSLHQFMLSVGGSSFRCECGCNVFHKPDSSDLSRYKCNACPNEYTSN